MSAKNSILEKQVQYLEFQNALKDFTVFSLADIRQAEPRFHRRRLNGWQEKGYIKLTFPTLRSDFLGIFPGVIFFL